MSFGTEGDVEIKIVVDASGAIKLLDQTGKSLGSLNASAITAAGGISKTQGKILSLEAALSVAGRAFSAMSGAARSFFGAMERADAVEDLSGAFVNLQGGAGAASEKLKALQAATEGTATKMDLMQMANQAVMTGLDDGKGRVEKLAAAAKQLGEAFGKDTSQAFDQLATSLSRGTTKGLVSLGVMVEGMKEGETRAAFLARAMKAIEDATAALGGGAATAAGETEKLLIAWEDIKNEFVTNLSASTELAAAIASLRDTLISIDWATLASNAATLAATFMEIAATAAEATAALVNFAGGLAESVGDDLAGGLPRRIQASEQALSSFMKTLNMTEAKSGGGAIVGLADDFAALFRTMEKAGTVQPLKTSLAGIIDIFKSVPGGAKALDEAFIKTAKSSTDATGKTGAYLEKLKALLAQYQATGKGGKKAGDDSKKLVEQYDKLQQQIQELTGSGGMSTLARDFADAQISAHQAGMSGDELAAALKRIADQAIGAGTSIEDVSAALKKGEQEAKTFEQNTTQAIDNASRSLSELSAAAGLDLGPDAFGAILGQLPTDWADALGGEAATAIFGSLAAALGNEDKWKAVGGVAGTALGAAIGGIYGGAAGAAAGAQIGGPLGSMLGGLAKSMFGGEHADSKFRGEVGDYFKEAFNGRRLRVIIGDELKELESLDMGQYVSSAFDNITPELQGAYSGIAEAISQGFAGTEGWFQEFAGQLTNILVNTTFADYENSLLNLRVLMMQTGMDAETLGKNLSDAYMAGDLSAKQMVSSMDAVNKVMGDGLQAVGDTKTAFQSFMDTAQTSGSYATQTLADLAKEAEDLNIHTLEELKQQLIKDGFAVEDVDAAIQALKENGITDPTELVNLDPEQVARIVDAMERLGVPMEEAAKTASELNETLKSIQETDWEAHVKVIYEEENKPKELEEGVIRSSSGGSTSSGGTAGGGLPLSGGGYTRSANFGSGGYELAAARSSGGSSGSSGGSSGGKQKGAFKDMDWEPGNIASQIVRLIESSEVYRVTLDGLRMGTVSEADAAKTLSRMRNDATKLLRQQEKLEARLSYAMEHRDKISKKTLLNLMQNLDNVNMKLDSFGSLNLEVGRTVDEEMQTIVDQFRAGNLSLADAVAGIEKWSEAGGLGLPGLADIVGAMEKLNGATTGTAIEGLRNLGVEAKEAGWGLGELQDYLEGKGYNAEKFFGKAAELGIKTMDDLVNASEEDIIQLLGALAGSNASFFPFLTGAGDAAETVGGDQDSSDRRKALRAKIKKLREEMAALPKNSELRIELKEEIDKLKEKLASIPKESKSKHTVEDNVENVRKNVDQLPKTRKMDFVIDSNLVPLMQKVNEIPKIRNMTVAVDSAGVKGVLSTISTIPSMRALNVAVDSSGVKSVLANISTIPTARFLTVYVDSTGVKDVLAKIAAIPTRKQVEVELHTTVTGAGKVLVERMTLGLGK